ncbi:MAG TPA: ferritin-like domain-containing protein [Candidatus Limnocylindrales bacterium]|nr:ferritin-like domain-containing protein [Candidatus Limnocylindrales bacterium]
MAKKVAGLEELLVQELQDLYDAEKQLVRALPKMVKAASNEELQNAFRDHLEVTKGQVQRLEQVFEGMDQKARSKPCKGMKGIVEEGNETLQEDLDEGLMDAAIIGAGRRVEHYEMAGYASVIAMAKQLGLRDAEQLLNETLREEMETDKLLANLGKRLLKESGAMMQSGGGEPARSKSGSSRGGSSTSSSKSQKSGKSARSSGSSSSKSSSSRSSGHGSHPLMDHDEIQQWAEERNAVPSCVRGTGDKGDTGMLRLNFPGYSGEESLEEISWDDWFEKFDERGLALLVQETTAEGQKSNFNKLVSRETAKGKSKGGRTKAAH